MKQKEIQNLEQPKKREITFTDKTKKTVSTIEMKNFIIEKNIPFEEIMGTFSTATRKNIHIQVKN